MGRNKSRSPEKKKMKKEKKADQSKQKQLSRQRKKSVSQQSSKSNNSERDKRQRNKKQKRSKSRDRFEKKKDKKKYSRQRQRNKRKESQRSRSRSKKKFREEKQKKQEKSLPVESSQPKIAQTEDQRLLKLKRRQLKARLLKYQQSLLSDDSQQLPKQEPKKLNVPPPPPVQPTVTAVEKPPLIKARVGGKRQSKWDKTTSAQPSLIPVHNNANQQQLYLSQKDKQKSQSLSLDVQHSDDHLKLSQDKSMDIQEPEPKKFLDIICQAKHEDQQIDPLDLYLQQIEGNAVAQMDLPQKNKKTIAFQEIVIHHPGHKSIIETEAPQEQEDEQFKVKFLEAIANRDKPKQREDRGIVMEHNQDVKEQISDFQEEKQTQLDYFAKIKRVAERKELHQVDHNQISYQQVRFNLYREADQVKNMDPKLVNKYRKEAGDIKVRGKDILNPVLNWYHCGFNDRIHNVIQKRNYGKPFPIQAQSLPLIMSGRDIIGIAQTGSGKTLAYLLPMLKHVMDQRKVQEGQGPIGIIMTPTRQLARQVYIQAKIFCKSIGIRVLAVYGGLGVQSQLSDLKKGVEIIICTPGRMIDILTMNKGKITNLKKVTMIVIDEADRMFDLGFQPQITRILDNVRPNRQTVLFSATFPRNVEILAKKILKSPIQIIVGSRGQACRNVEQVVQVRQQTSKFLRLLQILGVWNDKGSILIFVDKQTEADFLFQQLLKYGYHALVLHGAMDPDDRQFTIYDFKKGVKNIMIATSVCARGLDIKSIVLVVNFKCPNHLEDYIHRIGRTGRAGNKGTAITFITPQQQQYSIDLLKALQMSQIHPPQELIKLSKDYLGKVKKGQARRIRNRNIQGTGYKFDQEQEEKIAQVKEMLKKQMKTQGIASFSDSDDEDIQLKKKKQQDMRGRNQQEKIAEVIKNPQIKAKLLNEAVKAVNQAISSGVPMTTEKLLQVAVNSMKQSVTKHKVIRSVDDGVQQVTKLINQFQSKGGDGDFFTYDFEINDYPNSARQKACSQQFLQSIQVQTNCNISLRGFYVQPGKKIPVGCRKLYLHIQGENKHYVSIAYKQIKRVIEQNAYESLHMGMGPGKYAI